MNKFKVQRSIIIAFCCLFGYLAFSFLMLYRASTHELIVYAIVDPKGFYSYEAMPFPFGRSVALNLLDSRGAEEFESIFLYDIFSLPDELALESVYQGYNLNESVNKVVLEIASILIEKGSDVNAVNFMGCTGLQMAVHYKNEIAIEFFLNKKANIDIKVKESKYDFCQHSARWLMSQRKSIETKQTKQRHPKQTPKTN